MDEAPNDSGGPPTELVPGPTIESTEAVQPDDRDPGGFRVPTAEDLRTQLRRPAVWGLLLLIMVALAIQLWLLFL